VILTEISALQPITIRHSDTNSGIQTSTSVQMVRIKFEIY